MSFVNGHCIEVSVLRLSNLKTGTWWDHRLLGLDYHCSMAAEDLLQLRVAHCFHLVEFERCWKKKAKFKNSEWKKYPTRDDSWKLWLDVTFIKKGMSSKYFPTKRRHLEAPLSFLGKDTFLPSLNLRSMLKWSFAHMFFSNDFFIRYNGDCHDRTSLWSSEWTWTLWVKMTRGF